MHGSLAGQCRAHVPTMTTHHTRHSRHSPLWVAWHPYISALPTLFTLTLIQSYGIPTLALNPQPSTQLLSPSTPTLNPQPSCSHPQPSAQLRLTLNLSLAAFQVPALALMCAHTLRSTHPHRLSCVHIHTAAPACTGPHVCTRTHRRCTWTWLSSGTSPKTWGQHWDCQMTVVCVWGGGEGEGEASMGGRAELPHELS